MQRVVEPELMCEPAQAIAYAQADFEAPHARFIELFRQQFPEWHGPGRVLDLGCGPGDIAIRFARAYPNCWVDGVDGAAAMIEAGRPRFEQEADLARRVHLHCACLPEEGPPHQQYDAVISNSLLHHLHQPQVLWQAVRRYAKPGAPVFVVDLLRPDSREEAKRLQELYVAGEPDVLRHDFFHSLLAAFTVAEVKEQLAQAGLAHLSASQISDRHLMVQGRH